MLKEISNPPDKAPSRQQMNAALSQFIKQNGLKENAVRVLNWVLNGEKIEGKCATPDKQFEFTISNRGLSYKPAGTRSDAYSFGFFASNRIALHRPNSRAYLEGLSRQDGTEKRCNPSVSYSCGETCIKNSYACHLRDGSTARQAKKLVSMAKLTLKSPAATLPVSNIGSVVGASVAVAGIASVSASAKPGSRNTGENEVQKVLAEKENAIRNNDYETGVLIHSETGEVLFEKKGNKNSVGWTFREGAQMKGHIMTHNHPSAFDGEDINVNDKIAKGSSFSPEDIFMACHTEMAEMRAVSLSNTHSMKPPKEGWNKDFWEQKVLPSLEKHRAIVMEEQQQAIYQGTSPGDATYELYHQTWQRVAQETGMTYTRTQKPITPEEIEALRKPVFERRAEAAARRSQRIQFAALGLAAILATTIAAKGESPASSAGWPN